MKNKTKKFYITTAIDYPSSEPHIGHAYQKIIADVLARWHKLLGEEVFFLTGTDEHGQKISKLAREKGISEKEFVDEMSAKFKEAWQALNIKFDRFIRTTDQDHVKKSQEFIKIMDKKGDIYKGKYSGLYCLDCEAYVAEKDLINGKCPFHPNKELTEIKEEAYFFKLSKYQKKLLEFYKKNPSYVMPKFRKPEIINRVKQGLRDLNITRSNFKWGVPFPLDNNYVTYVWYEALLNYLTGIDWPNEKFKKFWPADVEILGVDNGWFHCVIWPAMLFSVGIKPPRTILINGFLTFNGQKISKSLGNAISPTILVKKYGADSIRYFVCRNFVFGQDGDFNEEVLIKRHNTELADKLGNLVSRVSALAENYGLQGCKNNLLKKLKLKQIAKHFKNFEIDKILALIFEFIDSCNLYVQENELWKTHDKKKIYELCDSIKAIAILLWPFIPETSEKIAKLLGFKIENLKQIGKPLEVKKIKKSEILFKKIEIIKGEQLNSKEKFNKPKIPGIVTMDTIKFSDWQKLDLRVGKILGVREHPNADKLVLLDIDLGELGIRTLVAGLKQYYTEKELKGKQVIVFTNLEPKEVRGIKSEGMILAAVNKDKSKVILIAPEKTIEPGSEVE